MKYVKGSLFDSLNITHPVFLAHSTNCVGSFGAGIAKEFKERWPQVYYEYLLRCNTFGKQLLGLYSIHRLTENAHMLCLYTSVGYGKNKDEIESILLNTERSVVRFLKDFNNCQIHMPKINSGLFRVPWHKTETILNNLLNENVERNHSITVWEQ